MNFFDLPGRMSVLLFQLSKIKFKLELSKVGLLRQAKEKGLAVSPKDYWDLRALSYDRQYGRRRDRVFFLEKLLSDPRRGIKRVIELGCGTGGALHCLAKKFPGILFTGVDISLGMLRKAREKSADLRNISFVEMNIKDFKPGLLEEHDLVVTRAVLQHLAPEVARLVLSAVLERPGVLYLEELHVRGYRDGLELSYPGYTNKMFYNHDYIKILSERSQIMFRQYDKGMILRLLCIGSGHKKW